MPGFEASDCVEGTRRSSSRSYAHFCPKVEAGEGRILQCLGEHEAQMSPECKTVRTKVKTAKAKAEAQAK